MKLKIKVLCQEGTELPEVIKKGDWIDLKSTQDIALNAQSKTPVSVMIPLGVSMKLPEGFEAIVAPRSSSFSKFGFIVPNSIGIIDHSYCGNNDIWKLLTLGFNKIKVNKGDRICQFRIQLSQKATFWQKLKWLFSSGIELQRVNSLGNNNRGGIGSTGR